MDKKVVISVVVSGEAAEGLMSVWPEVLNNIGQATVPEGFRQKIEDVLYRTVPSSVSRTKVKRGMKVSASYLIPLVAGK